MTTTTIKKTEPKCDGCGEPSDDLASCAKSPRLLCSACVEKPARKPYEKPAIVATIDLDDLD